MAFVYSFPDIKCTLVIPAIGTIYLGADAGRAGIVTVRLLKTATVNGTLADAYYRTTASGRAHGNGTFRIKDISKADGDGDDIGCYNVAFAKFADVTYAKEGGEMVWTFHCGRIHHILGPIANYSGELSYVAPDP
jgi:hypothetical protein